ncbi:MAG: NrdH-redoxin [Anaerolineales bacterium]|nr:NrdH-redoxin [Anaerolineales bacterium]MCB0017586.1 NrdH-redoxin [Anaerolineales bacterium]
MNQEQQLIVYTKSWCGDCHRTKRLLDNYEIPYQEIDAEADPAHGQYIAGLNGGQERVPTLIFPDGSIMVEPSDAALSERLGLTAEDGDWGI